MPDLVVKQSKSVSYAYFHASLVKIITSVKSKLVFHKQLVWVFKYTTLIVIWSNTILDCVHIWAYLKITRFGLFKNH